MSTVIPIIGMHRSGTSLATKTLKQSGLFVGEDLLRGDPSNPEGHFEDQAFLQLHKDILDQSQSDTYPTSTRKWQIDPRIRDKAKDLISERNKHDHWGWKDPRTCLFLPFWQQLLESEKVIYIIVLRNQSDVVRSLLNRDRYLQMRELRIRQFYLKPWINFKFNKSISGLSEKYAQSWVFHYSNIIEHILDKQRRFYVVEFEQLKTNGWITEFAETFDIPLSNTTIENGKRAGLRRANKEIKISEATLNRGNDIYNQLKSAKIA